MLQEVFDVCQTPWESTYWFGWQPTASNCKDLLLLSVNSAEKCFKHVEKGGNRYPLGNTHGISFPYGEKVLAMTAKYVSHSVCRMR